MVAHSAPQSLEFSNQEYWSGWPLPCPGDLPDQGLNLGLLHCRQILYCLSHQGSPVREGRESETREEQSSSLEAGAYFPINGYTHNNIFELFCRCRKPFQVEKSMFNDDMLPTSR